MHPPRDLVRPRAIHRIVVTGEHAKREGLDHSERCLTLKTSVRYPASKGTQSNLGKRSPCGDDHLGLVPGLKLQQTLQAKAPFLKRGQVPACVQPVRLLFRFSNSSSRQSFPLLRRHRQCPLFNGLASRCSGWRSPSGLFCLCLVVFGECSGLACSSMLRLF